MLINTTLGSRLAKPHFAKAKIKSRHLLLCSAGDLRKLSTHIQRRWHSQTNMLVTLVVSFFVKDLKTPGSVTSVACFCSSALGYLCPMACSASQSFV